MQGFSAKVVSQTAVSRLSGHYDKLPRGHAALMHSGFTALAKKNARPCGLSAGELVRLDQTREPVSCTLNPGTADEVTVMAQVVIVKHDLPDTLIGMSVIGPAGLQACFHKQRLKYYIDWGTPNACKAFLKCQIPIDFDAAAPEAVTTLIAYTERLLPLPV
jgi:hypothetical protein